MAARIVRKDGLPLHLILFTTNRCDLACEHCFLIAANELNDKSSRILTLDEIRRLALSVPDLTALSLTEDLMALYDVLEDVRPHFVTLNMMRGVDWTDRPADLDVDEYRKLNARKDRLVNGRDGRTPLLSLFRAKDRVMTHLVAETCERNRSITPCYAGRLMGVIKDNGDVLACEQLSTPLGNLRDFDHDFARIWFGEAAETQRASIKARKCHCTHECVMSSNVLFNPAHYGRLLRAL